MGLVLGLYTIGINTITTIDAFIHRAESITYFFIGIGDYYYFRFPSLRVILDNFFFLTIFDNLRQ